MLRSLKELIGYGVSASDGEIGRVHDFLFDQATRQVRYMVVDSGSWLNHRYFLVAPVAFGRPRWPIRDFPVRVTRDQVRHSPEWTPETPLSRQQESRLHSYYEWLPYWLTHPFGRRSDAVAVAAEPAPVHPALAGAASWIGCRIQAMDGDFGHVADFVVDDEHWMVTKLVIDTEYWWPQWSVMIDLPAVTKAEIESQRVTVALNREEIRHSPEYDSNATVNHQHEVVLYDYLGRPRLG